MGRLSGFSYREIVKRLKKFGFSFYRQAAGSHEIWRNEHTKAIQLCPIIQEICLKALFAQYCDKPESM
ncbi:MAG: type II toxin-antitoxin system HicA family toxin [Cyclobacteriaceae bacterium]